MNDQHVMPDGHLLPPATSSYVSGLILYKSLPLPETYAFASMVALSGLCLVFHIRRNRLFTIICLCLTFFLFGITYAGRMAIPALNHDHIVHRVDSAQDAVIIGTLSRTVTEKSDLSRAQIDAAFIRTEIDGPFRPVAGRVLLTLKGTWPSRIKPGDSLQARTTLQYPPVNNTPGTFNYREYLARKDIFLTGFVTHPILLRPTNHIDAVFPQNILYRIESLRTGIGAFINTSLPQRSASIYKALLIGDRSEIAPGDLETFKRSGIMHLLAISGLHISLIAALLYSVILWAMRRSPYLLLHINARKTALLLLFPALLLYALLTGANPPVLRSLIMITVFIAAFGINRFHAPLTPLTSAALLILLVDPLAVFSASFQLSFVAAASILTFTPKVFSFLGISLSSLKNRPVHQRLLWLFITIGIITLIATAGTFPLMIYHFNRISLVTLPANLLIQPIVCFWSLPVGILSLLCSSHFPDCAAILLKAGAWGLDISLTIGSFLSNPERTQLWLPDPNIAALILYYCGLIVAALNLQRRMIISVSVPLLIISSTLFLLPISGLRMKTGDFSTVSILDVGHGSAGVIEMANGRVMLIDGGAKSTPGYDCGERVIAPFLWYRGIGRIDDIFITHDDADHYNGIPSIITRFRPDRLFIPVVDAPKKGLYEILSTASKYGVQVLVTDRDLIIGHGAENLSIFPAENPQIAQNEPSRYESEDDKGLVLKFVSGTCSVLFPGDITSAKENEMSERLERIESTVLLSSHHGSSSSNSYRFLADVNPEYLIFSAKDNGSGLFPSAAVLDHAARLQIDTYTTSEDGSVFITFSHDSGCRIETFNQSERQFYRKG